MSKKKLITKCCICGREKTEQGWIYRADLVEEDVMFSHGLCSFCYQKELMKIKYRTAMARESSDVLYT